MATIKMHMKFLTEILKQTWLKLQKPCHPQTDRQGETIIPRSNFIGLGYNKANRTDLIATTGLVILLKLD